MRMVAVELGVQCTGVESFALKHGVQRLLQSRKLYRAAVVRNIGVHASFRQFSAEYALTNPNLFAYNVDLLCGVVLLGTIGIRPSTVRVRQYYIEMTTVSIPLVLLLLLLQLLL